MREFVALQERRRDECDWHNWRAGLITSMIANVNRDPDKHDAFSPRDFMPSIGGEGDSGGNAGGGMTDEEKAQAVKAHLIAVTTAMGGTVQRRKLDLNGRWVDVPG